MPNIVGILRADIDFRTVRSAVVAYVADLIIWEMEGICNLFPKKFNSWLHGGHRRPSLVAVLDEGVALLRGSESSSSFNPFLKWSEYSPSILGETKDIVLKLPAASFFERSFDVPSRAASQIQEIAEQEIKRKTPFDPNGIHHAFALSPKSGGLVAVHQTIVRRSIVDAFLTKLGLDPSRISMVVSDGPGQTVPVRLHAQKVRQTSKLRRALGVLALTASALAVINFGMLWWSMHQTISGAEVAVGRLRREAVTVRGLEDEVSRVSGAVQQLEARRNGRAAIDFLREVSRLLPDGSWITDWRISEGAMSMSGFSSSATALVALMEKSPLIERANLAAPITIDPISGRERFSLVARIRGGGSK